MDVILVFISVFAQLASAVIAFRLNVIYGWRPAWTLIATALLVMAVRRIVALAILVSGDSSLSIGGIGSWDLSDTAALATCVASVLLLIGVALISPLYRSISAAESGLRFDNEKLEGAARDSAAGLDLARQIQEKLLPPAPPELQGFDIAAISLPAESVGGDSFDYRPLMTGEWLFSVTDVSGHGVGPALQMAQLQTAFRTLSTAMHDPGEMLGLANRLFHETSPVGHFATVFLCCLDLESGSLRYAAAGHQAWILREASNSCVTLGGQRSGLVVGVMPDVDYCTETEQLQPGDALLLATDGVAEMRSPTGELFGVNRMLETVQKNVEAGSEAAIRALVEATTSWRADRPQLDDFTELLVIRRRDQPSHHGPSE